MKHLSLPFDRTSIAICHNLTNYRVVYYRQTSVLFLYNGGIFRGYQSLLALYLSGTPSLKTSTRPPSCLHLNNRLYICLTNI